MGIPEEMLRQLNARDRAMAGMPGEDNPLEVPDPGPAPGCDTGEGEGK